MSDRILSLPILSIVEYTMSFNSITANQYDNENMFIWFIKWGLSI
jgi:hypothetical protein